MRSNSAGKRIVGDQDVLILKAHGHEGRKGQALEQAAIGGTPQGSLGAESILLKV